MIKVRSHGLCEQSDLLFFSTAVLFTKKMIEHPELLPTEAKIYLE